MRIWTRKSALIQPRTSLGKSDAAGPEGAGGGEAEGSKIGWDWPRHHHSFRRSFSAGSTPIVASKYAFCSIFQELQENHLLASKFAKFANVSIQKKYVLRFFLNF